MNNKVLTTYEIARHCQITPRTVIQWINEGKLKAYRTPGNHSRVTMEDFLNFLKKYNMPIPAELIGGVPQGKKRILIVDDDKGMVNSIERVLQHEKIYDLEKAYDGFEAGQKFADFKPDLIILDIKMPGINGHEVCALIRKNPQNHHINILFISGALEEGIRPMEGAGKVDYLAKPFKLEELKMKLHNLLGFNRRAGDAEIKGIYGIQK